MKMHENITPEIIMDAIAADNSIGFCLACGEDTRPVEPDAEKYRCPHCDEFTVYGADIILFMFSNI